MCGVYTVLLRTDDRVECEIVLPAAPAEAPSPSSSSSSNEGHGSLAPGMQGRMIMGIVADGDDLVVYGETVMWKKVEDEKLLLPLERKLARGNA